jgi:hypothetical protein
MWYWNDRNFEGLLNIAKQLDEDPRLKDLADYCRLREQGLRKSAFEALDKFLNESAKWDTETSRKIIDLIFQIQFCAPDVHQFISTPLNKRFLLPGLKAWLKDEPNSREALRWEGFFNENPKALNKLLSLHPDEIAARRRLIKRNCLDIIYYATHLCQVNRLLMPISEVEEIIASAEELISSAPDRSQLKDIEAVLHEQISMFQDWKIFTEECNKEEKKFTDWCEENGRTYKWGILYFYEK